MNGSMVVDAGTAIKFLAKRFLAKRIFTETREGETSVHTTKSE
jgi:hypothetical protein